MQYINSRLVLRNSRINGSVLIYLRITTLSQQKYISTGIKVERKNFNLKTHIISSKDPEADFKNKILSEKIAQVNNIILDFQRQDKILTLDQLDFELKKGVISSKNDFCLYVNNEIELRERNFETKKTYFTQITKLKHFKEKISFADLTKSFVEKYFNFCLHDLKNKESTAYKSLSMLKTFVRWAIEDNLIFDDPFAKIKIKKINGNREYLTRDEVKLLEILYNSNQLNDEKQDILGYFLFGCYTGLRFQDIKDLTYKNFYYEIIDGEKRLFIKKNQHKLNNICNSEVIIPIIDKAKEIVFKSNNDIKNKKVFQVRSNQITNKQLKKIIDEAGIDKNISFHCARHTFATLSLNAGIPFEIVSNLLGHHELRTTKIYAKVTNENKFFQLLKLDEKL